MRTRDCILLFLVFSLLFVFSRITIGLEEIESRSRIVFSSWDGSNCGVFVMFADGSGLTRLTSMEYNSFSPRWSPDGTRIVYASNESKDLFIMHSDGGNKINITNTENYAEGFPAWSPDGKRIAYVANRDDGLLGCDIYVVDDRGNRFRLTDTGHLNVFPEWSPDGKMIAFITDRNGSFDLFIMNSDGSEERYITSLTKNRKALEALAISWAPDGSQIAFSSDLEGSFDIYVIDLHTHQTVNLTKQHAYDEAFPTWSPDGSRIAFLSYQDGNICICTMNRDGSNKKTIPISVTNVVSLDWSGFIK